MRATRPEHTRSFIFATFQFFCVRLAKQRLRILNSNNKLSSSFSFFIFSRRPSSPFYFFTFRKHIFDETFVKRFSRGVSSERRPLYAVCFPPLPGMLSPIQTVFFQRAPNSVKFSRRRETAKRAATTSGNFQLRSRSVSAYPDTLPARVSKSFKASYPRGIKSI